MRIGQVVRVKVGKLAGAVGVIVDGDEGAGEWWTVEIQGVHNKVVIDVRQQYNERSLEVVNG